MTEAASALTIDPQRLIEDLQALAKDALRHRLVLTYQALAEEVTPDSILDQVISSVPVPQIDLTRSAA